MENKSHAIAAGTFVLVVSALAVGLVTWLTRDETQRRMFEMSTNESVNGLQPQAGVRYKGIAVGRVTALELDAKNPGQVLVRIAVDEQVPITQSTYASLGFQGVTGLAFVQLDDSGESTQAIATSEDNIGRIPMRAGLVSRLSDQGGRLLGQMEQVGQRVNGLLGADNQKILLAAVDNIGQAAASINRLSQHADQMFKPKPGAEPINFPQVAERLGSSADALKASANTFKAAVTRINEPGGALDRITSGTDALANTAQNINATLLPRMGRIADDANQVVRQAGQTLDTLNETPQALLLGKGAPVPGPGESGFVHPPSR